MTAEEIAEWLVELRLEDNPEPVPVYDLYIAGLLVDGWAEESARAQVVMWRTFLADALRPLLPPERQPGGLTEAQRGRLVDLVGWVLNPYGTGNTDTSLEDAAALRAILAEIDSLADRCHDAEQEKAGYCCQRARAEERGEMAEVLDAARRAAEPGLVAEGLGKLITYLRSRGPASEPLTPSTLRAEVARLREENERLREENRRSS